MAELVRNNVLRTCIFVLIALLYCALGQVTLERHKRLPGLGLRDSLLWTDTVPRSAVRCVLECRRTDRCYAITVSAQTSLCSYYDWWLDSEHPLIMGYTGNDDVILVKPIPGNGHCKTYKKCDVHPLSLIILSHTAFATGRSAVSNVLGRWIPREHPTKSRIRLLGSYAQAEVRLRWTHMLILCRTHMTILYVL